MFLWQMFALPEKSYLDSGRYVIQEVWNDVIDDADDDVYDDNDDEDDDQG